MSDVYKWDSTADNNSSASPNGFPEAMAPSGVNNSAREVMAAIKRGVPMYWSSVSAMRTGMATVGANPQTTDRHLLMDSTIGVPLRAYVWNSSDASADDGIAVIKPTTGSFTAGAFNLAFTYESPTVLSGAAPSVLGMRNVRISNSVTTTITSFTNGVVGQEFTFRVADSVTCLDFVNGSNIKGNNGNLWKCQPNDFFRAMWDGTYWSIFCSRISRTREFCINVLDYYGSDTTDAQAINAALAYASTLSAATSNNPITVLVPATKAYNIDAQISIDSNQGIKLLGFGGEPILTWTGSTLNPVTQDDNTGAMFYISGTDHAFGGIEGLFCNCANKTVHWVYLKGSANPDFVVQNCHAKWAQLDMIKYDVSGNTGPVVLRFSNLTFYPASSNLFGGVEGVCGRYPIHIKANYSTGMIIIDGVSSDTGISGFLHISATTFAGWTLRINDTRVECYQANTDIITTDYGSATSIGNIWLSNFKWAAAGVLPGTVNSVIRNVTATSSSVAVITFDPIQANDTATYVYLDDKTASNTVTLDTYRTNCRVVINGDNNTVGQLPKSSAMSANPMNGDYSFDDTNSQLIVYGTTGGTMYLPLRKKFVGPATATYTISQGFDKTTFHDNNFAGAQSYLLPTVASVGIGGAEYTFYNPGGHALTIVPNGTDKIRMSNTNIVSTATAGCLLTIFAGHGSNWQVRENLTIGGANGFT